MPSSKSIVANGEWAGQDLVSVIAQAPEDILGNPVYDKYHELPLLAKFIDAKRDLSIQVHPNDEMARRVHGKMGKSEGNCIYLIDDEKTLRKKVMRAVTDEGPKTPDSPVSEPIANLFTLMDLVSEPDVCAHFRQAYADCSIRYGDLKKQLAEDILKVTLPIRERILDIRQNDEYLSKVVRQGAERARETASKTLADVREIMGIKRF